MKALTLHQPYASLIGCGAKKIETRSWHTWHTGDLAIHAAKTNAYLFLASAPGRFRTALTDGGVNPDDLPLGAVIAVASLQACIKIADESVLDFLNPSEDEQQFGDFRFGRYAWVLDNIRVLFSPIPARGYQRIWNWDAPAHLTFVENVDFPVVDMSKNLAYKMGDVSEHQ